MYNKTTTDQPVLRPCTLQKMHIHYLLYMLCAWIIFLEHKCHLLCVLVNVDFRNFAQETVHVSAGHKSASEASHLKPISMQSSR